MPEQVRATVRSNRDFSRRQFLQYSAAGLSAALLTACAPTAAPTTSGGEAPAAGSGEAPAASGPQQGGTLRLMGHQEVAGMGPQDQGASVQEAVIYAIHNSLLLGDEMLVTKGVLAESYEVAEDGLTYTFNLVQGVKFHDDADFTAQDVVYTYDFYRDEANATSIVGDFLGVESVEATDDFTVVVHMASVNASSLVSWAETPIVQSAYHAEVGEDTYRTAPVGTGAFQLVNWVPAEVVELEAFENHFRGRPNIDAIRQEVVPDASVRAIALETGDSDACLWPLLVEDSKRLAEDPNFTVLVSSTGGIKHIPLNNQHPALSEKEVRQALLTALDRQRIVDELWNGAAKVANTHYSPKYSFYSKDQDPAVKHYDYSVDGANALLDGAGWVAGADGIREKDGVRLSFTCTTITGDTARRPIAELAQQMLAEAGVEMLLEEAPVSAILEALPNGDMDASLFNWTYGAVDPDPADTLRSGGAQNFNNYSNARVDELIDAGVQTVVPEERQAIYYEMQDIIVEDVPMLYLQWDDWYNVFSSRVKGLPEATEDGFTLFFNGVHTWWLDPVEA
ncbi:MAG: twin-arginine translocation signal domain-containing protein [Caldilineaceae bacterium]|nr:twin-arginine translocation signal domain-containing protein [Caldilineaceae bacterium]